MKYRIRHVTEYSYESPVTLCYNVAHMLPRDTDVQTCLSSSLSITPQPIYQKNRLDYFGNQSCYFSLEEAHNQLMIDAVSEIDIEPAPFIDLMSGPTCGDVLNLLENSTDRDVIESKEFVANSPLIKCTDELANFAAYLFQADKPLLQATMEFTSKVFNEFVFDPTSTTVTTPLPEILANKRGVCQDFAHFSIGCLRSLGFPVRYVSGYIETLPAPGQEKLVGADASHAWFSIYVPTLGWIDFDPTNNNMPRDQHIVTAWGRDYSDVTPLQGVIFDGGDNQILSVSVDVQRLAS